MNYYLSTFLSGKNEEYIIKNDSNKVLYQFCCCPNISSFPEPNMGDLILSFLKKLNHFPIYIHVLSHGYKSNLSDYIETKKINNNNFNSFYTVGLIQNLKQLEEFFPISYLDSSNGETVLITSEKEVPLIKTEEDATYLKFELNVNKSNKMFFYLSIGPDGDSWDYLSNCANHPYENTPIIDEC